MTPLGHLAILWASGLLVGGLVGWTLSLPPGAEEQSARQPARR